MKDSTDGSISPTSTAIVAEILPETVPNTVTDIDAPFQHQERHSGTSSDATMLTKDNVTIGEQDILLVPASLDDGIVCSFNRCNACAGTGALASQDDLNVAREQSAPGFGELPD